jgi:hypothetical protein
VAPHSPLGATVATGKNNCYIFLPVQGDMMIFQMRCIRKPGTVVLPMNAVIS